jgi:tRNA (Thr-GGU) A37 N-methylase
VKIGPIEVFDGTPVVDIKSAWTVPTDDRRGEADARSEDEGRGRWMAGVSAGGAGGLLVNGL